jgi:aspartyl protease family protein
MSGEETVGLIWGIGALALVGSSLIARRLPIAQTLKMILAWLAIFAVALVLVSYRAEFQAVWQRVVFELTGEGGQTSGETLRIRQSPDGHFWVRGTVNGVEQRFLVDSGATTTALSMATATQAGIDIDGKGYPVVISTANGNVEARRATVERFVVGPIVSEDLAVIVSPAFGDFNVIGMNFLSSLQSWRVEGTVLILVPRGARADVLDQV